jgi:NAD(P)-dependent dehydrogenase (short-subunit alcohol dehydrogenase family)
VAVTPKMQGKRVLVTGAGTGIGQGIALEFAQQGADIVIHYGSSADGARKTVEEIRQLGGKAEMFRANFENIPEVQELADKAIDFLGGIDVLVNNAGITFNKPFLKCTFEQFNKVYHVNIRAQFFLTQKVVEDMLKRGQGAICNISSIHGIQGAPEHAVYAGTKGAILAYTRALAVELAWRGIRVNAIAPGWITVDNYYSALPGFNIKDAKKDASEKVPVARYGLPEDIAKIAVFLCSDDAGYIVGQTIVADGGTSTLISLLSDFRNESSARFGERYL